MALDIAALRRVLHHQFSRYFSILPLPVKHTSTSKHDGRSRREFKYSAMLVDGTDSKKVQFRERGRARRNEDEAWRRRKGRTTKETRRWEDERTLGPCRLNGTELKSFAWRQARHVVVVVVGSWAWQSSRQRHACLPFPVHPYNWNSRKKKRDARGTAAGREKKRRLARRIALLMEPWLSVGSSYNVHYIYLPGSAVLPECRPEGPPPVEHKAVKRFNSIRAAERGAGSTAASSNLTPPLVLRFGNRRRGLPCLSVLTHRVLFASPGFCRLALDRVR